MKTTLPQNITSIEEAKTFLLELLNNGESFHLEDDAREVGLFTEQEGIHLNRIIRQIYDFPGNQDAEAMVFDPIEYLLDMDVDHLPGNFDEIDFKEAERLLRVIIPGKLRNWIIDEDYLFYHEMVTNDLLGKEPTHFDLKVIFWMLWKKVHGIEDFWTGNIIDGELIDISEGQETWRYVRADFTLDGYKIVTYCLGPVNEPEQEVLPYMDDYAKYMGFLNEKNKKNTE